MKYQFLILVSITTILAFGPYDQTQGEVSKLLYLHVPTVWVAYLAYTVTFIYSLRYLISKKPKFLMQYQVNFMEIEKIIFTMKNLI